MKLGISAINDRPELFDPNSPYHHPTPGLSHRSPPPPRDVRRSLVAIIRPTPTSSSLFRHRIFHRRTWTVMSPTTLAERNASHGGADVPLVPHTTVIGMGSSWPPPASPPILPRRSPRRSTAPLSFWRKARARPVLGPAAAWSSSRRLSNISSGIIALYE